MANLTKVYTIEIQLDDARQQLADASKRLEDLKAKTIAANQEAAEAKQVYKENARELKALQEAESKLDQARANASGLGAPYFEAANALKKNIAAQKELTFVVEESKEAYEQARAAAEAANAEEQQTATFVKQTAAAVKEAAAAEKERAKAAKQNAAANPTAPPSGAPATPGAAVAGAGAPAASPVGAPLVTIKPGTIGALREEVKQLAAALELTEAGSQEAAAAIQKLAEKKAELHDLDEQINALNPKKQVEAFTNFSNGIVGAFSVATVAAQTFGLSSEVAKEYEQKLVGLLTVMNGVEAISRALNSDNLAVVKSTLASAKAWITAGEAASTSAKVTRAALISTGIGVLIVLVGTLIANWENLKTSIKGGESFFTKVGAVASGVFRGMIAYISGVAELLGDLFTGDIAELITDATTFGKKVGDAYTEGFTESVRDSNRRLVQLEIEKFDRLITVAKAAGKDTEALEEQNLVRRIANAKRGNEEEKRAYLDLIKDLEVLQAARYKKEVEQIYAFDNALTQADIARRQARGEQTLALELALREREYEQLNQAETKNQAAIAAKAGEVEALKAAIIKDATDRAHALQVARLNGQLQLEQAKGNDAVEQELALKRYELKVLLSQADRSAAAIAAKEAEITTFREKVRKAAADQRLQELIKEQQQEIAILGIQGKFDLDQRVANAKLILNLNKQTSDEEKRSYKDDFRAYQLLLEQRRQFERDLAQGRFEDLQEQHNQEVEENNRFYAGAFAGAEGVAQKYRDLAKRPPDLGRSILENFFGVDPEKSERIKEEITQAAGYLLDSLNAVGEAFLSGALQEVDKELQRAKDELDKADDRLKEATKRRQDAEKDLEGSTGARRDYLLQKIRAEQAAEERLAKAKAKAAADEERATKRKHDLEKKSQQLAAASALATNIATAASAVYAGVQAVSGAAALPFPASLPAMLLAVATVATVVASAKQLSNASKYESGVTGLVSGPSHKQGGIQLWHKNGVHLGEMEGGESITPVDATKKNYGALELIRTVGRTRTLLPEDFAQVANYSVLPPPSRNTYFEAGGTLPTPGSNNSAPAQVSASEIRISQLEEKVDRTNALLEQVVATNIALVNFGPPILAIGPGEAQKIEEQKNVAEQSKKAASLG